MQWHIEFVKSLTHGPHPSLAPKRQAVRMVILSLLILERCMCLLLQADHIHFAKEIVSIAHAACIHVCASSRTMITVCPCLQKLGGEISCQAVIQHMLQLQCLAASPRFTTTPCNIIRHDSMTSRAHLTYTCLA